MNPVFAAALTVSGALLMGLGFVIDGEVREPVFGKKASDWMVGLGFLALLIGILIWTIGGW